MLGNGHSPDWSSIDTVLLDMDGTVLDLGCDIRFWQEILPRQYAEQHGITVEEAHRRMRPIHDATRGTLDWYCVDYWSRALSLDIVALKRATRHHIAWLPESREFVARVRASRRRVVLVTNAHPEIFAIKDAHLGVRRHFDAVYSSHDLGVPKEDTQYWQRLQGRESYDRSRTLFADDTVPVLESARRHGIRWLYAIRKPVRHGPPRAQAEIPGVDAVHELAAGLDRRAVAQPPGA
ncbi:MAG: GMP/IMP nucleotidase [Gammaproteobacteria bacterium]